MVQFMLLKPVFSNHLSYVTIFQFSLGRSHKTGLTICVNTIELSYFLLLGKYCFQVLWDFP